MSSEEPILIEQTTKRIKTVIFNRPEVLNCFNLFTLKKFYKVIEAFENDTQTRVVIFKGKGRAFSTGNDLKANMTPDEAKQFQLPFVINALCWVHIERHFKKLNPKVPLHHTLVNGFRSQLWEYYDKLKAYQQQPNERDTRV